MNDSDTPKVNPWTVWVLIFIMLSGILVYYSWLKTVHRQYGDGKPPLLRPVDRFRADGHNGKPVELFDTKNRFYLVGYFYAGDEKEALAVCERMKKMRETFPEVTDVSLVGFSMAPELDNTKKLSKFANENGYTSEEWIFVTGDRDRIRTYMNKFFRYPGHQKPDEYRETETDLYARELRISLVFQSDDDEEAFIRGVYWEGIRKGEVKNDSNVKGDVMYLVNQKKVEPKKEIE